MIAINEPIVDSASLAVERHSCENKFGIAIVARMLMIETVITSSGKENPSSLFFDRFVFFICLSCEKKGGVLPPLLDLGLRRDSYLPSCGIDRCNAGFSGS